MSLKSTFQKVRGLCLSQEPEKLKAALSIIDAQMSQEESVLRELTVLKEELAKFESSVARIRSTIIATGKAPGDRQISAVLDSDLESLLTAIPALKKRLKALIADEKKLC